MFGRNAEYKDNKTDRNKTKITEIFLVGNPETSATLVTKFKARTAKGASQTLGGGTTLQVHFFH